MCEKCAVDLAKEQEIIINASYSASMPHATTEERDKAIEMVHEVLKRWPGTQT